MKSKKVHIPKVHDHQLISHGCKHPEGSPEIIKENLLAAIDAALDADVLGDNGILVCYRSKDQKGWCFGIAVTSINDLKEIVLNLDGAKKLVVEQ